MNEHLQQIILSERTALAKDSIDLFLKKRAGHMGHWEYSEPLFLQDKVQGVSEWDKFLNAHGQKDGAYYTLEDEISLIKLWYQSIYDITQDNTVMLDIGPGVGRGFEEKSFYILSNLYHQKFGLSYAPFDHCENILESSQMFIRKNLSDTIKITPLHQNFMEKPDSMESNKPILMTLFGLTLGNLHGHPSEGEQYTTLVRIFKNLRRMLKKGDKFVVTQDSNQDAESNTLAYCHQEAFAKTILYRIQRDLNVTGNFDADNFSFQAIWNKDSKSVTHNFVALNDMKFSIEGAYITVKKDDVFTFNNSFKHPWEKFSQCAYKAGFKSIAPPYWGEGHRIVGHTFEAI